MITPPVTRPVNNGLQRAAFVPKSFVVTNVTNALVPTVTTDGEHGYSTGQIIRLVVPPDYGMQINDTGLITVTTTTQFTIDIDTSNEAVFNTPTATPNTQTAFTNAQVEAVTGTRTNIGAP